MPTLSTLESFLPPEVLQLETDCGVKLLAVDLLREVVGH